MHQASYMICTWTNGSNKQAVHGSVQYSAYCYAEFANSLLVTDASVSRAMAKPSWPGRL